MRDLPNGLIPTSCQTMRKISHMSILSHQYLTSWALPLVLGLVVFGRANAPAQEPEAEIKLFVVEDKIDSARKQIKKEFDPTSKKKHQIYFFDTRGLELYENTNGPVILRAREKEGKKPQSTVKFRRPERDKKLEKKLMEISAELEIQTEWVVGHKGPPGISYALDAKFEKSLSELEGADSSKIASWFSHEQKKFLKAAGINVDWQNLRVFGPVNADVWQWNEKDERVNTEATAELWRLGDTQIFEVSCKKPGENLAEHVRRFVAFFKDQNIFPAENPQSKTKQALDYFAKNTTSQPPGTMAGSADRWHKVGDGKLMGISGMALLGREGDDLSFLVVHDNKKEKEARAGVLRCKNGSEPKYVQLDWPGDELPKDLETLTAVPGASSEYLTATSKGKVYRIKATTSQQSIEVMRNFNIPGVTETSEIEGLALGAIGNTIIAAWADRGDGEKPATFSWGTFNPQRNELTGTQSTTLKVPWPEKNARDVSDVRIDGAGAVFITSAYESDDDASNAAFASAVYLAGVFKHDGDKVSFSPNTELTRLFHFEGRKIEALELVSGPKGSLVLATDDEERGSSVYLDW
jgi:hypothetical protein